MTPDDTRYNGQTFRYDRTIKTFQTFMKDNNDVIIVGDDNIDTLKDNNKHNIYNNYDLKDLRQQFMIDNDMTQHNFKLTFTRNGLKSCIDHIYSNCSYKITDVVTQNDILSDHNILTFNYNNNKLNIKPTYKIKRDFNLLNTDILTQYCDMNDRIDTVFDYDTSNDIADILIDEINNITGRLETFGDREISHLMTKDITDRHLDMTGLTQYLTMTHLMTLLTY